MGDPPPRRAASLPAPVFVNDVHQRAQLSIPWCARPCRARILERQQPKALIPVKPSQKQRALCAESAVVVVEDRQHRETTDTFRTLGP